MEEKILNELSNIKKEMNMGFAKFDKKLDKMTQETNSRFSQMTQEMNIGFAKSDAKFDDLIALRKMDSNNISLILLEQTKIKNSIRNLSKERIVG